MADPVWFWQRIVTPHMAELAKSLAAEGLGVTYVAEREMSATRAAQGWQAPSLGLAQLHLAPTAEMVRTLVHQAPSSSIHICQGFRGNGLVNVARRALAARGLRQWVITEAVDDAGWRGHLKRLEYRRLIGFWRSRLEGVLSIGHATRDWLIDRGMPPTKVFPFAYFLADAPNQAHPRHDLSSPFQLLFVGRLVELKRVGLLLDSLFMLNDRDFELTIVGTGPIEGELRAAAEHKLPGHVRWLGQRPLDEIPALMAQADCLVLPSRHDGWGAVMSEAMMVGTPVICSDACGGAGAVRASGQGGVFGKDNSATLAALLGQVLDHGRQTFERRSRLATWARCLGAASGARYLKAILAFADGGAGPPSAPWHSDETGYGP